MWDEIILQFQTSTMRPVQPLKFGNDQVFPSHALLDDYLSMLESEAINVSKISLISWNTRDSRCFTEIYGVYIHITPLIYEIVYRRSQCRASIFASPNTVLYLTFPQSTKWN